MLQDTWPAIRKMYSIFFWLFFSFLIWSPCAPAAINSQQTDGSEKNKNGGDTDTSHSFAFAFCKWSTRSIWSYNNRNRPIWGKLEWKCKYNGKTWIRQTMRWLWRSFGPSSMLQNAEKFAPSNGENVRDQRQRRGYRTKTKEGSFI